MASRREELKIGLTAQDQASKTIDAVAEKVEALDGRTAEATVDADVGTGLVEAESTLDDIDGRTVEATVDADIGAGLVDAESELDAIDGLTVTATVDADIGSGLVDAEGELDDIDGRRATATVDADVGAGLISAESDLDAIDGGTYKATVDARTGAGLVAAESELDAIDGGTYKATVDADIGAGLSGLLDKLGGLPGAIGGVGGQIGALAGPGGAVALLVGALGGAAIAAGDVAIEADNTARFTGSSVEEASKLHSVLRDKTNVEAGDLLDIIAQMQGVLAGNPQLATDLGISMDEVRNNPLAAFISAVDALAGDQLTANEKILLGSQLFGEEGVRQVNEIIGVLGSDGLRGDMDAIAEGRVINDDDVAAAREMKEQWAEVSGEIQTIITDLGQGVIPLLSSVAELLDPLFDTETGDAEGDILALTEATSAWLQTLEDSNGVLQAAGVAADEAGVDWNTLVNEMARLDTADPQEALDSLAGETDEAGESAGEFEVAIGDQISALEDEAAALEETIGKLEEYIESGREAYDAQIDYREATEDTADALGEYQEALTATDEETGELITSAEDLRDAGQEVIDTTLAEADALVEMQRKAAIAAGETWNGTAAIDAQNTALINAASTIPDELLPAYAEMIATINLIPEERETILTMLQQGVPPEEILGFLEEASRSRKASIEVEANKYKLDWLDKQLDGATNPRTVPAAPVVSNARGFSSALDWLTRDRNVKVHVQQLGGLNLGFHNSAEGRFVPGGSNLVTSTGEISGRRGDEVILPLGDTARMAQLLAMSEVGPRVAGAMGNLMPGPSAMGGLVGGGGGGGGAGAAVYHVTVNMPPGSNGDDVLRVLQQVQRRRGTLPLRVAAVG